MAFPYIDMHCDTLMRAWREGKATIQEAEGSTVTLERLRQGNCGAQFFACFLPPLERLRQRPGKEAVTEDEVVRDCARIWQASCEASGGQLRSARTLQELLDNQAAGAVTAFFSIEDGRSLDNDIEQVERYWQLGVRMISMTWNFANCLGFPNSKDPAIMEKGLTDFGKEVVEAMNARGMVVDVSHLSDGGFWDVVKLTKKPFVASHSNCRAVANHTRNLTDEMIRALADKGGVTGLNMLPEFLSGEPGDLDASQEKVLRHIRHLEKVGGIDCIAIGSDFDGMPFGTGINEPSQYPALWERLLREGYTPEQVEKMAHKNVERVLAEVL